MALTVNGPEIVRVVCAALCLGCDVIDFVSRGYSVLSLTGGALTQVVVALEYREPEFVPGCSVPALVSAFFRPSGYTHEGPYVEKPARGGPWW